MYHAVTQPVNWLFLLSYLINTTGPPSKVLKLTLSDFHLSWTPPSTIDLTDIDPDLYYNVSITKTVIGYKYSTTHTFAVACKECPLATPEYMFTPWETGPCVSYRLSVFAFNAAGRGESSSVTFPLNPTGSSNILCCLFHKLCKNDVTLIVL